VLHDISALDTLNSSNRWLYNAIVEGDFRGEKPDSQPGHAWTDVRDVATAHVLALKAPEAGGERILIPAEEFVWQGLCNEPTDKGPCF
jgi:nucleoside-diphosphate-sugar epimerase